MFPVNTGSAFGRMFKIFSGNGRDYALGGANILYRPVRTGLRQLKKK